MRMCNTDYRKVNAQTRSDSLPLPRIDDIINSDGNVTWQLLKFIGMAGYYRRFCKNNFWCNCSTIRSCKPKKKFVWSEKCQEAFRKANWILTSQPYVSSDFNKPLFLQVIMPLVQYCCKRVLITYYTQYVICLPNSKLFRALIQLLKKSPLLCWSPWKILRFTWAIVMAK